MNIVQIKQNTCYDKWNLSLPGMSSPTRSTLSSCCTNQQIHIHKRFCLTTLEKNDGRPLNSLIKIPIWNPYVIFFVEKYTKSCCHISLYIFLTMRVITHTFLLKMKTSYSKMYKNVASLNNKSIIKQKH